MASPDRSTEPNSPKNKETTRGSQETAYLPGFWRHGRYYGSYRPGKYLFPIDSEELDRFDLLHKFFLTANEGQLTTTRLRTDRPQRIMDLGTGSAIWPILFMRTIPDSECMVVDLNLIQPPLIPVKMTAVQFDLEEPCWDRLMRNCDLIHIRVLLGCIQTDLWPAVYKNIFNHLQPGSGYLEQTEIDWDPRWDESGDTPVPSNVKEWADRYLGGLDASKRSGRVDPGHIRRMPEDAGFIDIEVKTQRLFVSPWNRSESVNETARWFNLAFTQGMEGMSLMPMIDYGDLKFEEVRTLCQRVEEEMAHLRYRVYMTLYIWKAKRPSL